MAKARRIVSDTPNAEVDELRRQFNNLLVIIENATDLAGVQAAIAAGADVGGTEKEINGVKPMPLHPRYSREGNDARIDLDASSDF